MCTVDNVAVLVPTMEWKCVKVDNCTWWCMQGQLMDVGLVDSRVESSIVPRIELILGDEWFLMVVMWSCLNVSELCRSTWLTGCTIE